ncbi:MAG: hypothetical protein MH208_00005, partial [Marinobacter sp.]|nr:hypothetical protein [Marinobacter sp.]
MHLPNCKGLIRPRSPLSTKLAEILKTQLHTGTVGPQNFGGVGRQSKKSSCVARRCLDVFRTSAQSIIRYHTSNNRSARVGCINLPHAEHAAFGIDQVVHPG